MTCRTAVVLLILATASPALAAPATPSLAQRIDAYLEPYIADKQLSGTILLARRGEVVYERSFGQAHFELGVGNTAATRFCIASISKPMTAVLVHRLVEDERLALAHPVSRYLPDFPRGGEITVDHLLNHRSGLPHRVTTPEEETRPWTAEELAARAATVPLEFPPGTQEAYSSAGYSVLARIVEVASGMSYAETLRERVLGPLGMTETAHVSSRDLLEGRATSWLPWPGGSVRPARLKDYSFLVGAGSMMSTPRDLLRFVTGLRAGRLGEGIRKLYERPRISWNGLTNGFRAFLDDDAVTGLTVIVTSNMSTGALDRLRTDLPRVAAGEVVPRPSRLPPFRYRPSTAELRRYEGTYALRSPFEVSATPDGVLLSGDRVLVPVGEKTFFSLSDYGTVRFEIGNDGKGSVIHWQAGDDWLEMRRVP